MASSERGVAGSVTGRGRRPERGVGDWPPSTYEGGGYSARRLQRWVGLAILDLAPGALAAAPPASGAGTARVETRRQRHAT